MCVCVCVTVGDTHMLRYTGMCRPNGLHFHQKSLDMGPILVKKSLEEVPFHKNCENIVKSAGFEVAKPLEMGLNLRKKFFRGKKRQISRFLREKNPRYG